MNTKPDALKLASVPIFERGIGWQADATATLKEQASEIERLRAALLKIEAGYCIDPRTVARDALGPNFNSTADPAV